MANDAMWVAERCPQCGAPLPTGGERVACIYCGSRLSRSRLRGQPEPSVPAQQVAPQVHLKTCVYIDSKGLGGEAFRMLIPHDWTFEGGVDWPMDNPGMPGVAAFRVYSPDGLAAFEAFPNLSFFWTNNPMVTMTFPMGSSYFGQQVRPPAGANQVLREIVIPRYRGQVPGLQIVGQESLPGLLSRLQTAGVVSAGGPTAADGAKIRIRYRQGDVLIEEEIYGVVEVTRTLAPTMMGMVENIFWMADYLCSCRGQVGQLEALTPLFEAIVRSFRIDPQWYNRYVQLTQYLIQNQMQHIRNIGQISRMISQTSSEISDMAMEGYRQQQETRERMANHFSQVIRGVDEYQDPVSGGSVELPGGYGHAWANALNEYIVTDDPSFDPNLGSNQNWQPMRRQ